MNYIIFKLIKLFYNMFYLKNISNNISQLVTLIREIHTTHKDIIVPINGRSFEFDSEKKQLIEVENDSIVSLSMLIGIDSQKNRLLQNTLRFIEGYPYNNALLWGARGMGKSSLVKTIHKELSIKNNLVLIAINREDINHIPFLLRELIKIKDKKFILYCDDLSFENEETNYKSLKSILDGSIQDRPENIVFYITSNRRHLLERNKQSNYDKIGDKEIVEERISLSDRFGLWLGFHQCDQDTFLSMVELYAKHFNIIIRKKELHKKSLQWAILRGSRSGRVAWQFTQDLLGTMKIRIKN